MLGYTWDLAKDILLVKLTVNTSRKKFGTKVEKDLTLESCERLTGGLRLMTVMSVVASIYDPLGLITPFTLRIKLLLQTTHQIEEITWDEELPEEFQQ